MSDTIRLDDLPSIPSKTPGVERVRLDDFDPKPAAASGTELLDQVVELLSQYLVFARPEQADVLALWIAHTHAIEAAECTPYLQVTSAVRESGKSRVGDVVWNLVARPLSTANTSVAALFRSVRGRTLLFDEIDATFNAKNFDDGLRGLLNAGYARGQLVLRMGGKNNTELQEFEVFGPKMLIGIGGLPDTLSSRCVPIAMKRKRRSEKVRRLRRREILAQTESLQAGLSVWAESSLEALRAARPEDIQEISDRAADVWEPLLAIAALAGDEWLARARKAALALSGARAVEDESLGIQLLADIRTVLAGEDHIGSTELVAALKTLDESPWLEYGKNGLTAHTLARLLRPFDVHPHLRRIDGKPRRGYWLDQLADPFERLLPPAEPPSERYTVTDGSTMPVCGDSKTVTESARVTVETGEFPLNQADRNDVTVQAGDTGARGSNGDIPAPGDRDFPGFSDRAAFAGRITWNENRERQRLHEAILRARVAHEAREAA